jgi:hypothetical protein
MGLELPWYGEMKRDEGAFATLLGLDVRPPTADRPGLWRAAAVGDSCLVRVRKGRHLRTFPVTRSLDFGNAPHLIGSWGEPPPEAEYTSGAVRPGDRLLLVTDALAQWVLQTHERGGYPWESVMPLLSAERAEVAFAAWVEDLRGGDGLRDDDVTLLIIEAGPAPQE